MTIDYGIFTDKGSREINEDSASAAEKDGVYCFTMCDGLGGHGKGEVASGFVTDNVKKLFMNEEIGEDYSVFLTEALNRSQEELLDEQKRQNSPNDMKTTAVVMLTDGKKVQYAHIGDSRLYHFRKGRFGTISVHKRTTDHSVPQMLVMAGEIEEKDIRQHPDRSRLLRVMGMEWENRRYDISEAEEIKPGDSFLLCSDGFWEPITEKEMIKLLKRSRSAQQWLETMAERVKKNGEGKDMDNFTAVAVCVKG